MSCWLATIAAPLLVAVAVVAAVHKYAFQRKQKPIVAGSTAIITGGGSGIGLQMAIEFSKHKCNVILVGRNEGNLQKAVGACMAAGSPRADYVVLDLTQSIDLEAFNWKLQGKSVDYLVLNAGQGAIMQFDESPTAYKACEDLINLNYLANVRLIQRFRPSIESNSGSILVVSSLAGVLPSAHRAAYTASKHAMQGFCNALRQELRNGASLTVVCPGFVATDFHDRVLTSTGAKDGGHGSSSTGRKCATAESVAKDSIKAMREGRVELIMTSSGRAGYILRPLLPYLVDTMAKRKALASIKSDDSHRPKHD
eukprot:GILI01024114.1.p1 GENE.GILI01024114.1~~GILI01024114.1.p1  ORF type:complete len:325 (-),score=15.98 GILI01024114.1:131-1063(-)